MERSQLGTALLILPEATSPSVKVSELHSSFVLEERSGFTSKGSSGVN